jgi:hypothetical protein
MAEVEFNTKRRPATDAKEIVQAVRSSVAEHHGLHIHTIFLLKPGGVPKTTSGKIQRNACRSWCLRTSMTSQRTPCDNEETIHG